MKSWQEFKHTLKKHLVKIAVKSGLLRSEDAGLRNLLVVKLAARLGLLKRWTFNRQCTDEARQLGYRDSKRLFAYSNDVIEHLHPDDALMHFREVPRVLNEEGRYYFWTPGKNSGPHDFTKNFYLKGVGVSPMASYIREYNFAEMIEILKEVGYRKVTIPDLKKEVLLIAEK
ncbi:MAG: hypothetical protein ACUBOA_05325 [Candidatus Loosdrechtia sp.]|uniref:hypothetical protein n=1 Tax=Candidatus Loosdrechtia sp. TaxID=3101272 RepID=UPI003A6B705F|nr:MAG: hypothetical protein QY305_12385 [Candidatus Jettenia sp. AMX2]